eukprot:TRINITY_DN2124_c0_g1_i7.p2 TRINITY_DN2124_c0_g1~~TRINITY_DN2124_c0_g1_i7.p2  ORF type:complete len:116 (+),score=36.16 TRINITY_DN2124_c0_g1_i7:64-411(+)
MCIRDRYMGYSLNLMLYKDRGVTLDRLELLWNGRGYPDKFGISLSSRIYSDHLPAKRIRVLRNTGIISFKEAKSRLGEFKDCKLGDTFGKTFDTCLLYTSPSPRDQRGSRMPSSA